MRAPAPALIRRCREQYSDHGDSPPHGRLGAPGTQSIAVGSRKDWSANIASIRVIERHLLPPPLAGVRRELSRRVFALELPLPDPRDPLVGRRVLSRAGPIVTAWLCNRLRSEIARPASRSPPYFRQMCRVGHCQPLPYMQEHIFIRCDMSLVRQYFWTQKI
jgi:hypothetical protein